MPIANLQNPPTTRVADPTLPLPPAAAVAVARGFSVEYSAVQHNAISATRVPLALPSNLPPKGHMQKFDELSDSPVN